MKDWILLLPFPASNVTGESHKTLFVLFIFIFSCLHYGCKKRQGWLQMKHLCLKKEHLVPEPQLAQPYKVSLHNKVRAKVKQGKNWKGKERSRGGSLILMKAFVVVSIWFANNRLVSKIFLWPDVQLPEITMVGISRRNPWVTYRLTWTTRKLQCEVEFTRLEAKLWVYLLFPKI